MSDTYNKTKDALHKWWYSPNIK
ncbi:uncharacterized protein METZ01_LOCUS398500, partial [marine metagenome]